MNRIRRFLHDFTPAERLLWGLSVCLILIAFLLFDRRDLLTLAASLIGVSSLMLNARGNPLGQLLMVCFSLLYGIISLRVQYYGEMITYLGMTLPMALLSLITWLRHPFKGKKSEVAVSRITAKEVGLLVLLAAAVTVGFYFILRYFNTAALLPGTLSVTTSFAAAYLTARRSPWFALAYAANDLVLILLWTLAALSDPSRLSVIVCFAAFFACDLYGFIAWRRMAARQAASL